MTRSEARASIQKSASSLITNATQYRLILPVKVGAVVHSTVGGHATELLLAEETIDAVRQVIAKSKLFPVTATVDYDNDLRFSDGAFHFKVT